MSLMSAAEAGQPAGVGQELSPRGRRMARSVGDQDGAGADAGSPAAGPARPGPARPAGDDRRLRLVTTQVRVTKVRVAREFRSRTARAGGPEAGVRRTVARTAAVPGASAYHASVQRASAERLAAPGVSAHRARMQRASVGRVSVRAAAVAPGALRLTRRGRRVLTGLVMLVVIIAAMLIWTSVAGGAQVPGAGSPVRSPYQGMTQVVVQPGQTLWSVAAAAEPSADPWTVIQQIIDANALNGAQIQAGQVLWVPRN